MGPVADKTQKKTETDTSSKETKGAGTAAQKGRAKPTLTAAQQTAKDDAVRKDRHQAVDVALAQIEKQFGKGAIMKFDEREKLTVESIPTGSLALDLALGVGGIRRKAASLPSSTRNMPSIRNMPRTSASMSMNC
jgi:hypothetical protein